MSVRRIATCLALAGSATGVAVAICAGWQRSGQLEERVIWIAIGALLTLSCHLLPVLIKDAAVPARLVGGALWIGCALAVCLGHCQFFLAAARHAGELRAARVNVSFTPLSRGSEGRPLATVAADRAAVIGRLARTTDLAARTALEARREALDVEIAEARRREAADDRLAAQQQRDAAARDALRADPVSGRLAMLLGVGSGSIDMLLSLLFAATLEAVACFSWTVALGARPMSGAASQGVAPMPDESRDVDSRASPYVTPPAQRDAAEEPPAAPESDVTALAREVQSGSLKPTVAEIRRRLKCGQSRAVEMRRLLLEESAA